MQSTRRCLEQLSPVFHFYFMWKYTMKAFDKYKKICSIEKYQNTIMINSKTYNVCLPGCVKQAKEDYTSTYAHEHSRSYVLAIKLEIEYICKEASRSMLECVLMFCSFVCQLHFWTLLLKEDLLMEIVAIQLKIINQ